MVCQVQTRGLSRLLQSRHSSVIARRPYRRAPICLKKETCACQFLGRSGSDEAIPSEHVGSPEIASPPKAAARNDSVKRLCYSRVIFAKQKARFPLETGLYQEKARSLEGRLI